MAVTTDPLNALLAIRDGYIAARWNFADAVGTPLSAPGGIGNAVALTYSFLATPPSYFPTSGFDAFTAAERDATREVLEMFSSMARVGFTEVAGVGTMTFGMNAQAGTGGYAYFPSFAYSWNGSDIITSATASDEAGDVWLNSSIAWNSADFMPGGSGYGTLIHEIGHALGLKHPFEASNGGDTLDPALDSLKWTVMSYTEHPYGLFRTVTDNGGGSYSWTYEYIQPETLMPLDIVALQHLYGATGSHNAGKTVYTFETDRPFIKTIYDTGGSDTISVSNFTRGCVIDLRDGYHSSIRIPSDPLPAGVVEPNPGIYDGTDNLAIAFGTVIENATGGAGADVLLGNDAANRLNGAGGADTMTGAGGSDIYYVNNSGDRVVETTASRAVGGVDTVWSYLASCTLGANVENGRIMRDGSATLTGNGLANVLTSGSGDSVLRGGAGTDTASYSLATAGVSLSLAISGAQASGGSGSETLVSIENLTGSRHADSLTGNTAANLLTGGNGADTLAGGGGIDTLNGGAGADLLSGGGGADAFVLNVLGPGADTVTDFASGSDQMRIGQAAIRVGDGDTVVEGATTIAAPGGFSRDAELVIVTSNLAGGISASAAAAAIGAATSAYATGAQRLFVVDDGSSSALFLFTSSSANAVVSAAELTLLAALTGTAATSAGDFAFIA